MPKPQPPEQRAYHRIQRLVERYGLTWARIGESITYFLRYEGETFELRLDNWSQVENYPRLVEWLREKIDGFEEPEENNG